jgi:actin-related protein
MHEMQAIVIDNGSATIKVGLAGEQGPRVEFPNVVGRPRHNGPLAGAASKDVYVGKEALAKRGMLAMKCPFAGGLITNWDDMEAVWRHAFENELRVASKEHPVVITEPPHLPKDGREKITQIMFEKFEVPGLYLATSAALSLGQAGIDTGIGLDVGEQVSHAVPIYEGSRLQGASGALRLAGQDLTAYLIKILPERGYSLTTHDEHDLARDLKEKLGYVALDFDAEMEKAAMSSELEASYERGDGQAPITIGNERFRVAEALFKPSLIGLEQDGIHILVYDAIMKSDPEIRGALFGNVVLTGGSSMFPGIAERLAKELTVLAPRGMSIKVIAPPKRQHATWNGGAKLASQSGFETRMITAHEYAESGPTIVHRKCI